MGTNKLIVFLGTGIFFILTLNGIGFLVAKIVEELLLFTGFSPLMIYGISVYIALIAVLSLFVVALTKVRALADAGFPSLKKLLLTSVFSYVFVQFLAFLPPLMAPLYQTTAYLSLKEIYHFALKENFALKQLVVDTPSSIIKYTFMAVFIFRGIKSVVGTELH